MPSAEQTVIMTANLAAWMVRIARETLAFLASFVVGGALSWIAFKLADQVGPLR